MTVNHMFSAGFICALALAGCLFPSDGEETDPLAQQTQDIAQFESIQAELDEARTEWQGESADEVVTIGNRAFYLNFSTWAPTVHSYDFDTDASVHYDFNIGEGDRWNFRVSREAIATAEEAGQEVIYHVYDADEPGREISTVVFDAPQDEQRWWAYAVSGTDLYIVTTGEDTTLYRVSAGGEPVMVTTLESACGCNLGEFWEFGVEGGTMVFVESGRIWNLDLPTNEAEWLENETLITGWVTMEYDGILFSTSVDGPWFFEYATRESHDISALIESVDYRINETFASSHLYYTDPTRWRDYIIYIGSSGVFAYSMSDHEVIPILLEPRSEDVRIVYRYPRVTESGILLVTGLTSTSGAVGADGPVYQVDLANFLP